MDTIHLDDDTMFNPETGEVGKLPKIRLFQTDREILTDAAPATISWIVENAQFVWLNGQPVEKQGSTQYHGAVTASFSLLAQNESGLTEPRTLAIRVDQTPPVIHRFSCEQTCAVVGTPVSLNWHVSGAEQIEINGNTLDGSLGEKRMLQPEGGSFRLTARSFFGAEASAEVLVPAIPLPLIKTMMVPTPDIEQTLHLSINLPNIESVLHQTAQIIHANGAAIPFVKPIPVAVPPKQKFTFTIAAGAVFDRLSRLIHGKGVE